MVKMMPHTGKNVCSECGSVFVDVKHLKIHEDTHNRGIFSQITAEKEDAFLNKLRLGNGPLKSARSLGIDPDVIMAYQKSNPEFAQKVSYAEAEAAEIIEERLFDLAQDSDYRAIDRWLTDRSPDRWGKNSTVNVNIIQQIESAPLLERIPKLLEVLMQRSNAVSLPGDIIDAEIIEVKELSNG